MASLLPDRQKTLRDLGMLVSESSAFDCGVWQAGSQQSAPVMIVTENGTLTPQVVPEFVTGMHQHTGFCFVGVLVVLPILTVQHCAV
jgi:hypothetical protein